MVSRASKKCNNITRRSVDGLHRVTPFDAEGELNSSGLTRRPLQLDAGNGIFAAEPMVSSFVLNEAEKSRSLRPVWETVVGRGACRGAYWRNLHPRHHPAGNRSSLGVWMRFPSSPPLRAAETVWAHHFSPIIVTRQPYRSFCVQHSARTGSTLSPPRYGRWPTPQHFRY